MIGARTTTSPHTGVPYPAVLTRRGNDVTRIGICHARDHDAVGRPSETTFGSLRTANQLRSVPGTNHMIMTGRWYHVSSATDPNSVYVCRCPSVLKACYTSTSKRRGTLRAPQGDYPVGSHDVRRLVLLICCSAPACPPNKKFHYSFLSDGAQRWLFRSTPDP